ncbi:RagB/SusD family nutrient uptake outer membrane protein [Chitinophaga sp. CC14]|uniref:RagB/SusD family nutrient uptake outer membrane protein n=1 Tax=Chitinophaga sp. CC14 TaxID=3029199 RepID=UPI003B7D2D6F
MNFHKLHFFAIVIIFFFTSACKKEFLDKKPNTNIVVPQSLEDMVNLLDNREVMTLVTPALGILSGDEYYYPSIEEYNNSGIKTERNSYIWAKDIYQGDNQVPDWNLPYKAIFTSNVVLDQWDRLNDSDKQSAKGKFVKAWALFSRSYSLYNLVQIFAPVYNKTSAVSDLGIPLKLSPNVNNIEPRATVKETYDQILSDLESSIDLYSDSFPTNNRNRPSRAALYALLSRIYLSMQEYDKALTSANNSLNTYDMLIDYNSLDTSSVYPFLVSNDEVIFQSTIHFYYSVPIVGPGATTVINPDLIKLYDENDLRKDTFFTSENGVFYSGKGGYAGQSGAPFSGLAVDEIYLIKAECLARNGDYNSAMDVLNKLLIKRWKVGTNTGMTTYVNQSASSSSEALSIILLERRKELFFRGLRWTDLKRMNIEGANITLTRVLNEKTFSLPPNDSKYVMPIPDDEIALSNIQQNIR